MNIILVDLLEWVVDQLEKVLSIDLNQVLVVIIVFKKFMDEYGNVVFGGDGYFFEWYIKVVEECGLKNLFILVDVLLYLCDFFIVELFESIGVLILVELKSCFDVYVEQYILFIEVEVKLVIDMVKIMIYFIVMSYLLDLLVVVLEGFGLGIIVDVSMVKIIVEESNVMMIVVVEFSDVLV